MRVLDIGCGCARGVRVTGITLSENQFAYFRQTIQANNLQEQLSVNLCDYGKLGSQKFERIISVGMLEHVGRQNLTSYMRAIGKHLTENGVAVIHSIERKRRPCATSPWLNKYIFPGGYLPTLRQMLQAVEKPR